MRCGGRSLVRLPPVPGRVVSVAIFDVSRLGAGATCRGAPALGGHRLCFQSVERGLKGFSRPVECLCV